MGDLVFDGLQFWPKGVVYAGDAQGYPMDELEGRSEMAPLLRFFRRLHPGICRGWKRAFHTCVGACSRTRA